VAALIPTRINRVLPDKTMRQQRPRGTTTRELVVNAALEVADRVGLDALTIRAVAGEVGAPPMSLYTHFANKEELLDLMYLELSRRLYADSGRDTWQAELSMLARHVRETLLAHPRWAPLLSRRALPVVVPVRERILRLMVESGMPSQVALSSLSSAVIVTVGLVFVELAFLEPGGTSSLAARFDGLKGLFEGERAAQFEPVTREALTGAARFDFGTTFEVAIGTLIAGLETENVRSGQGFEVNEADRR
jgi:AcrR family transcriptional regulator